MMENELEFEVDLDRSVDSVWQLITDPDSLGTWMLGTFTFEPQPGSPLAFRDDDGAKFGTIVDLQPGRRLSWRWSDGSDASEVTIRLEGDDRYCTVNITEVRTSPRRWSRPSIPPMEASVA